MGDRWTISFPDTISILKKNIKLEPSFSDFMQWADANSAPTIVLSSGIVPVIRALLEELLDDKGLATLVGIVANQAKPKLPLNELNKGWWMGSSTPMTVASGTTKSPTIRPYAETMARMLKGKLHPALLYVGDGVSDLPAQETDLLFVKAGYDLITCCERENNLFTNSKGWNSILETTRDIFMGWTDVRTLHEETLELIRIEFFDK